MTENKRDLMIQMPAKIDDDGHSNKYRQVVDGYVRLQASSMPIDSIKIVREFIGIGIFLVDLQKVLKKKIIIDDIELIYQGSRDGFRANDFHRVCDDKGPTATLIKSEEGHVFGGYTSVSWTSPNSVILQKDDNAFLFLIHGHEWILNQVHLTKKILPMYFYRSEILGDSPVIHNRDCGPCFGKGDLVISDKCNENDQSQSNFPNSFSNTFGFGLKENGKYLLAGKDKFKVMEISVYRAISGPICFEMSFLVFFCIFTLYWHSILLLRALCIFSHPSLMDPVHSHCICSMSR